MYDYQRISSSRSYGGSRVVLTGTQKGVSSGKYNVDLATLPDAIHGCIPAGTPILMDDAAKTVEIHYAFSLVEAVTYALGAETMVLKLAKGFEGSRIRVGMIIGICPDAVSTVVAIPLTVTAVDRADEAYDSVSVSCTATEAGGTITAGTVLVEVADVSGFYIAVLPNAITFYDVVKLPDAQELYIDGLFCQADGVLLTRRVPPIAPSIKGYLAGVGNTYIRYSSSKE